MPIHDWTQVEAGIYHDFHLAWIGELRQVLNGGLLPSDFYALAEQHSGPIIGDIVTLHTSAVPPRRPMPPVASLNGIAVAEAPPKIQRKIQAKDAEQLRRRRRTMAIRHISNHRLVAVIEIVSPSNKDRTASVQQFVEKARDLLEFGVHGMVIDLFPPGVYDPQGMHGAIWDHFDSEPYDLPAEDQLTIASYISQAQPEAYLEHRSVGMTLPEMPLFLRPDRYILVPLESTYMEAYRGVPAFYKNLLEHPQTAS